MAKITYENKVALNQNSSIPDINKVNDTDMNMIKNVVNNNETKVLLAVSSSAPATCDTGDIYFNTTDNLIYTATATNTWGSTGVAPTQNTIYIEFSNQTLYAYDGTTLVSVGGGASGGGESLAIGTVLEFPTTDSTKVPDGWLFCDGSAVSRTTYADLFAIIGTSFGAGDGSTTFNLPTKEGLVSVGINTNDTDFNTIGKTGGSKALQKHHHAVGFMLEGVAHSGQGNAIIGKQNTGSNWAGTTDDAGTGNSGNLQPYTVTNYIIKATQTTPVQAEVVNDYSTSQENAYSCDYVNKAFGGTILWTNPNPSSNFNSQNITLNSDDYDCIEIIFILTNFTGYDYRKSSGKIIYEQGKKILIDTIDYDGNLGITAYMRRLTMVNKTQISAGVCDKLWTIGQTTSNSYTIPLYIIGYKTGLVLTQSSNRSLNTYSGDIEEKKDIVIDDGNK